MLSLLLTLALAAPAPVRQTSQAFGQPAEAQVLGLAAAAAADAVQKAVGEIAASERRIADGLAALNGAAGQGPRPVDPTFFSQLARAESFCQWSEGAHGPLGKGLYELWGLHSKPAEPPEAEAVLQAMKAAACDRLTLDPGKRTAVLAAGSGLDLVGFAEGAAVDRAVDVLRAHQVENGMVRVGSVWRAFGPGPTGKGWPVTLPPPPGQADSKEEVFLRDQSLAVVSRSDHPLEGGTSSYLSQRTGEPAQEALAVFAVTELAVDAQGLATTMLILGPREGELRIGTLRPRPSLLWFLGSGEGSSLMVNYRWEEVRRR